MSKAAGAPKKNQVREKRAKALWAMKAAKDRDAKDNTLGRNQTRQELWREHLKDRIEALDKALKYFGDSVLKLMVGSRLFVKLAVSGLWPSGLRLLAKDVGKTILGRRPTHWNVPGKCGPHGELFFFRRKSRWS